MTRCGAAGCVCRGDQYMNSPCGVVMLQNSVLRPPLTLRAHVPNQELVRRGEHIVRRLCAENLRSESRCSHGVLAHTTDLLLFWCQLLGLVNVLIVSEYNGILQCFCVH